MHSSETVERVLALHADGLGARRIASLTGLSPRTVGDWIAGKVPRSARPEKGCPACGQRSHVFSELDTDSYSYLLGIYLGDGYLARHPRGVYRLRISLDLRYPEIVDECARVLQVLMPNTRIGRQVRTGPWGKWIELGAYSKAWPCLFPQHGPGKKHERPIELTRWQLELVNQAPQMFLRGLIQSDGCRFENSGRNGWRASRYSFSNLSEDILALFCWACEMLGLRWTEAKQTIYVSRKADVARMDEFIGPKR